LRKQYLFGSKLWVSSWRVTAQGRELWTAVRPYQSVQADTVVGFEKRIKQRNDSGNSAEAQGSSQK
jgi:hypothetical protein